MTDAATAPSPSTVIAAAAVEATKIYGSGDTQVTALDHVTCEFARGQFTAIMGPSGSGKSTLMHCLAGLDRLTSGSVSIAGVDLSTLDERKLTQLRRDQVGFVFQAFNLIPTLSALENITLPLDLGGRKPDEAWVDTVVDHGGPGRPADAPPQRAVRRPAATRRGGPGARQPTPDHLRRRADREPRLADRHRDPERSCARRSTSCGQTIVMVTHDPSAASYSDRVLFLADGRIVDQMARADRRQGARQDEVAGRLTRTRGRTHVPDRGQGHPRPQAPPADDQSDHRDRGGVHLRDRRAVRPAVALGERPGVGGLQGHRRGGPIPRGGGEPVLRPAAAQADPRRRPRRS